MFSIKNKAPFIMVIMSYLLTSNIPVAVAATPFTAKFKVRYTNLHSSITHLRLTCAVLTENPPEVIARRTINVTVRNGSANRSMTLPLTTVINPNVANQHPALGKKLRCSTKVCTRTHCETLSKTPSAPKYKAIHDLNNVTFTTISRSEPLSQTNSAPNVKAVGNEGIDNLIIRSPISE